MTHREERTILERLDKIERIMSNISTELAAIQASLTTAAAGSASLDSQIQALLAQIAASTGSVLSSTDQASLDAIAAQSAALATADNAAVTAPVATPAPTAGP